MDGYGWVSCRDCASTFLKPLKNLSSLYALLRQKKWIASFFCKCWHCNKSDICSVWFLKSKKPNWIWKEGICSEWQWRPRTSRSLRGVILQWGLLKVSPWQLTPGKEEQAEVIWPRQISICGIPAEGNGLRINSSKSKKSNMLKLFWASQGCLVRAAAATARSQWRVVETYVPVSSFCNSEKSLTSSWICSLVSDLCMGKMGKCWNIMSLHS